MTLPILPTAIVGSYAMPGWLERLKTEYFARRISRHDLDEIHDAAVKAAIKDQEIAGLDIVTDGELRRDNMVDYFVERLPGVQIDRSSKKFYYDFYDGVVQGKLPTASLGLVQDFRFLRANTERESKICITGPHCLTKRIRNQYYPSEAALAIGSGQGDEPGAEGSGQSRSAPDSDRRTLLLRISRRSRLGRAGIEYAGGRSGRKNRRAYLLRKPLRQTELGGQLPVPVPAHSGRESAPVDAGVRAPRRRGSGSVQGVPFEAGAGPGRDRRQERTRWRLQRWWRSISARLWK